MHKVFKNKVQGWCTPLKNCTIQDPVSYFMLCFLFSCSGKKGEQCPACQEEHATNEVLRDNYSRKRLEKAKVFCQNRDDGCTNQMKLKELGAHLETCSFEQIPCVHKSQGCSAVLLRGQLAEHLQTECQFRPETCEFCGIEFPVADLKTHQEKCKASLVKCPNECNPDGIHQEKVSTKNMFVCD